MVNVDKIKALIVLLDDPNDEIFQSVEGELLNASIQIVPELEKAWEVSKDTLFQRRVENIIHTIQFNDIHDSLKKWLAEDDPELLEGAYLVAKFHYPGIDKKEIKEKLALLRKDIWLEINDHLTSLEKIRIVNHVLFDVHKFSRNNSRFFAPENNFISEVLKTGKGNPISLSIIYSILCHDLGMPVYGVNLPKNFILAFLDDMEDSLPNNPPDHAPVMFYINPINKGAVLNKREIDYFIRQQKLEPKEEYFFPCDARIIVRRLFHNLVYAYNSAGDEHKREEIYRLLALFDE